MNSSVISPQVVEFFNSGLRFLDKYDEKILSSNIWEADALNLSYGSREGVTALSLLRNILEEHKEQVQSSPELANDLQGFVAYLELLMKLTDLPIDTSNGDPLENASMALKEDPISFATNPKWRLAFDVFSRDLDPGYLRTITEDPKNVFQRSAVFQKQRDASGTLASVVVAQMQFNEEQQQVGTSMEDYNSPFVNGVAFRPKNMKSLDQRDEIEQVGAGIISKTTDLYLKSVRFVDKVNPTRIPAKTADLLLKRKARKAAAKAAKENPVTD